MEFKKNKHTQRNLQEDTSNQWTSITNCLARIASISSVVTKEDSLTRVWVHSVLQFDVTVAPVMDELLFKKLIKWITLSEQTKSS